MISFEQYWHRLTEKFPGFYSDPTIRKLAQLPLWSFSTVDKMPLDIKMLAQGRMVGANFHDPSSMTTLKDSVKAFYDFQVGSHVKRLSVKMFHAFYLTTKKTNMVLIDVEPSAKAGVRCRFLRTPYEYVEESMSGKGFHVLAPKPADFDVLPQTNGLSKFQSKDRSFELLFDHWVTFTRVPLKNVPPHVSESVRGEYTRLWQNVFDECMSTVPLHHDHHSDASLIPLDQIPRSSDMIAFLETFEYGKTPADFDNDLSRFEFGVASFYAYRLTWVATPVLTDDMKLSLLYEVLKDVLPHRDKHDETRDGLPLLAYDARNVLASLNASF